MDLSPAPVFKRRPSATSSPVGVGETVRSPALRSPSSSPSSPSSAPSSPLSTSSSFCANSSAYQNHVKSQREVATVSSSSASLTRQPLSTSTYNTTCVDCFPCVSMQSSVDYEEDDRKGEIYDPFSPTDGDKERRMEEEDGEKYDPFDPTGSPASDVDDGIGKEREINTNAEMDDEDKEEEPPDSTDTLTCPATQLSLRRRVEGSTSRAEGQKESVHSDHSEIEEGEIVTAVDKDGTTKRPTEKVLSPNSPQVSFFSSKPERILRVLDGDGFVSVCTEGNWEDDRELENEPAVGVEDLRRKLVSRRKERYRSFPASSPLSSQSPLPPSLPQASMSSSPLIVSVEQAGKNQKSFKSSNDLNQQKIKDRKAGDKEVRRKKKRKGKEGEKERSKEKEQGHKAEKEIKTRRSSRSSSRKRKKRQNSSPETSRNSSRRRGHSRHSFSSLSEERQREQKREKDKYRNRDRDRDRDRERGRSRDRERDKERHHHRSSSHRKDERVQDSSSRKREKERTDKRHSRSRERDLSKRSRRSTERRDGDRERQHEREHRRDGRPVVPPSIQDLNGSDLFAIKRTITVTTTTTTTTVPGSPRLAAVSPSHPTKVDDSHKRKKRKWHSTGDAEDQESCRSRSHSLSPSRYHGYESDRYSDKLEVDMLSLDGEALDSDYPSLEDTPPAALPPEPPVPSPKAKAPPKARRNHPKKKSHTLKKSDSSSSSNRTTSKCLSSLTVTSGSASVSSGLPSAKRGRKMGKDKDRDKGSRKDLSRSGKSKKESGSGRKGKLQSKVSVLVREGVSSTTGASVGSGKLSMDLLGPGGTGGGAGGSVVGGSIAVVFCRDNESRSPFLKPCSEPLSLSGRSKDLASMGKRSGLAAPPSNLTSSTALKSKKTKTGSITSTSSSASSPSSSLATKRRRRLAKKTSKKGGGAGLAAGDSSQTKPLSEGWGGGSLDVQSAVGEGSKSVSPHTVQAGPLPCSSSSSTSSSTSALLPSTSPPHTPPPSTAPLRDTRESSPDSQTVDSSCKTPDPSFLAEDCPTQTSPIPLASSPSSLSTPQGAGLNNALSTPTTKPPPPDDASKSLASPPCSSSSAGLTSFSLPLSSSDPSSSSSVSSSSASKPPPPPPPPPPPTTSALPWSLQTGVDCTTGGVLALTALLFKMEEANIASRAKAQEFIQATSQILSQANQSQSQQHAPPSSASSSSQIPPPPALPPPPGLSPAQFILHSSLPLVGCTKTPPSHLHSSMGGGCAQTPPPIMPVGLSGVMGSSGEALMDNERKDPDKYLKKLHTQERAVEEVKLAIKPYYQRKDINKDEYKDILRKAVHKICHSRTGEINPVKVSNLVKLYVQRYKYFRKHGRKMDDEERDERDPGALHTSA